MKRQYGPSIEVKSLDQAQGTFSGYGSVFGNLDQNGDIVERGAFTNTVREAKSAGGPFLYPLLRMHNEAEPVGGIVSAVEDSTGLLITAACDLDSDAGRAVFSGIQKGYMSGLSIGYNTVRSTRDQKGVRHLLEIKLWEISAITTGYAANADAKVDPVSVKKIGASSNMNDDWKRMRMGGVLPPMTTRAVALPEIKARSEYKSDEEWEAAIEVYHSARYRAAGLPMPRLAEKWDREDAFRDAQNAALAERCRAGNATMSEMLAYNKATGWTPSGAPLTDDRERIARAYAAVRALIAEKSNDR